MTRPLRTAPGMRERSPGVWELIVEAGRDPVSGKRRQLSRVFKGGDGAGGELRGSPTWSTTASSSTAGPTHRRPTTSP